MPKRGQVSGLILIVLGTLLLVVASFGFVVWMIWPYKGSGGERPINEAFVFGAIAASLGVGSLVLGVANFTRDGRRYRATQEAAKRAAEMSRVREDEDWRHADGYK